MCHCMQGNERNNARTRRIERKLYLKLLDLPYTDLMLTATEPRHVSSIRVSRMNKLDHRMNLKWEASKILFHAASSSCFSR